MHTHAKRWNTRVKDPVVYARVRWIMKHQNNLARTKSVSLQSTDVAKHARVAKHACTLRMWLCMKWHGCMVYTERAETAAVSRGTSHISAVSAPLRWIFKNALWKAIYSSRITCERSESARELRIALGKSDHHNNNNNHCQIVSCCIHNSTLAISTFFCLI